MTKFSSELRLSAVSYYIKNNVSKSETARIFGTTLSEIQKWVKAYEYHGFEGVLNTNNKYTGDFKIHVVEYMRNQGISARETAGVFNIPGYTTICKWERIYLEKGPEGLHKDNRGRPTNMKKDNAKKSEINKKTEEDLIAENQRLRMENEYLKKLNALVQEREKSAKKTR